MGPELRVKGVKTLDTKPKTLLTSKKGTLNDTGIMIGIIIIFVLVGATLPFINEAFSSEFINNNNYSLDVNIIGGIAGENATACVPTFLLGSYQIWCKEVPRNEATTTIEVLLSVGKMFFWTFGALPLWLDLIFIIFRVTLAIVFARIIRGVG